MCEEVFVFDVACRWEFSARPEEVNTVWGSKSHTCARFPKDPPRFFPPRTEQLQVQSSTLNPETTPTRHRRTDTRSRRIHTHLAAMICRQCLRRATTTVARQPFLARPLSTLPALRSAAEPAAATLSTPTTAAGEAPPATESATEPKSSCPAGTVLTGLNFIKGKQDPVALADEEYPEWLWRCLEFPEKATNADDAAAAEFCKPPPSPPISLPLPSRTLSPPPSFHRLESRM